MNPLKIFLLAFCFLAVMQPEIYSQTAPPFSVRARNVLDEVWTNIKKNNFDSNFEKNYHESIYNKYLPEIEKTGNDQQLAAVLNRMVKEFGQSHIQVLAPANITEVTVMQAAEKNVEPVSSSFQDVPADVGIIPCIAEGQLCVRRTIKGSAGETAGIKPGDRIVSINGIKFDLAADSYIPWDTLAAFMLAGMPESKVSLVIINHQGISKEYTLAREPNGFKWFKFGAMPRTYGAFYAEILPGNIGYVHLTSFFPEQIISFSQAITGKLKNVSGLIIDLRNNIGGLIIMPQWLAGWACPSIIKLGKLQLNGVTLTPPSYPQPQCFKGPVVILVNEGTASAAEIFAAAMQDAKAAVLFGSATSGKCLPSQFLRLPCGFRLQTVFGDYERENGKRIEHIGVIPDFPLQLKLSDLQNGTDTVREAASKYLQQQPAAKE